MNRTIRQLHRWVSIVFTLGVIGYIVTMSVVATPPFWVGLFALVPLIVLLATGLYLFALPYVAKARKGMA